MNTADDKPDTEADKPEIIAGPVTKSIWVEGDVRWRGPRRSHMTLLWVMWGASFGLLSLWLAGMAFTYMMNGWIHAFLGASILLAIYCFYYGFKYCDYLERPLMKGVRHRLRRAKSVKETVNFERPDSLKK